MEKKSTEGKWRASLSDINGPKRLVSIKIENTVSSWTRILHPSIGLSCFIKYF